MWNQHIHQLAVGLLAELVERCTGVAEVMSSNPVQAYKGLLWILIGSFLLFPIFPTASFDNFEWRGKFLKKLWCCVGGRV